MSRNWAQKRKKDFFHRKAKEEGFRSRAAYKLIQVNQSHNIIKPGNTVLDLGSAPGGWIQVVSKIVDKGKVLGVDIKPITPLKEENVGFLIGDVTDSDLAEKILEFFNCKIDVVISDLSLNIIGAWDVDHARQIDLVQHALGIAKLTLKSRGTFFTKVFDGPYMKEFLAQVKICFEEAKIVKPKASRPESAELYILARRFRFPT